MTDLVATALDRGRAPHTIPLDGDLLQNVLDAYTTAPTTPRETYSEERFRLRMRLAMSDRRLAQAYWRSHVSRRRGGMVAVLRARIERSELRPDLDLDACIDLVAWRGMAAPWTPAPARRRLRAPTRTGRDSLPPGAHARPRRPRRPPDPGGTA